MWEEEEGKAEHRKKHAKVKRRGNRTKKRKEEAKAREPEGSKGKPGREKQGKEKREEGEREKMKTASGSDTTLCQIVPRAKSAQAVRKSPTDLAEKGLAGRTGEMRGMTLATKRRKRANRALPMLGKGLWGNTPKKKRLAGRKVKGPKTVRNKPTYCLP